MNKIILYIRSVLVAVLISSVPARADLITFQAVYSPYIRNTTPDNQYDGSDEMAVGRYASEDWVRGLLEFDLSDIPDYMTITSVSLDLRISQRDPTSGSGEIGLDGLQVFEVSETFDGTDVTFNQRDDSANIDWTTSGGTFDPTPLSVIASPTHPDSVTAGQVMSFGSSSEFVSAVSDALEGDQLQLMVRTPIIESDWPVRKLYLFGGAGSVDYSPELTVEYAIPEPSTVSLVVLVGTSMLWWCRRLKRRAGQEGGRVPE